MIVYSPKTTRPFRGRTGCEITKNPPISHYDSREFFCVLTFLKRGIFTLVKILSGTFSVPLRWLSPSVSAFLFFGGLECVK